MKKKKTTNNKKKTDLDLDTKVKRRLFVSVLVFFTFTAVLASILYFENKAYKQEVKLRATRAFSTFRGHIQTFIQSKVVLINGFSAFIKIINDPTDNLTIKFLEFLLEDEIHIFRNIGLIEGTTVLWNYPRETNEKIIGVDLLTIPEQRDSVIRTRASMEYSFEGPLILAQGGSGFIIRVPFNKDGKYWGMISVVLKTEKMLDLFELYAQRSSIKVAITERNDSSNIIFGSLDTIKNASFIFPADFNGAEWNIFLIPLYELGYKHVLLIIIISFFWLFIASIGSYHIYKFLKSSAEIKSQHDFLSLAITKDVLTKIYNRNYLDARLAEEMEKINREDGLLSVIFFDLDHFKKINDTYGHIQGDQVLRETASIIKPLLRAGDVFGRWGGEEFLILMPATTLINAKAKAEKLRIFLEAYRYPIVGQVTASFGVAQYQRNENFGSFFSRTDKALYKAKEKGRNLVQTG